MKSTALAVAVALLGAGALSGCSSDGGGNGAADGFGGALSTGGGGASLVGQGGAGIEAGGSSGTAATGGSPGAGGGTAGAGGAAPGGAGGGSASGGSAGMGGTHPADKPPCLKDASQIVLIGDSYINWVSHTFPTDINEVSMLNIEDFAIGGTSMGSGGLGLISPQFDTALKTHPNIIAAIMDGGGNDVLVPDTTTFPRGGDCKMMGAMSTSIPDCQKIVEKAIDAGTKLFLTMADKGVKDVLFFFYPHVPTNTLVGGTDPNGMLDYALPKIQASCDGAYQTSITANPQKPIRCHFLSLVPVFEGHMDYFAATDIHPNPMGSKAMAAAVWAKMKQDCVAQPASSGCCTPQ